MTHQGYHSDCAFFLLAIVLLSTTMTGRAAVAADETLSKKKAEQLFTQQVRPLLKKRCLGCHGEGDDLEGDLDMRSREGLLRGGENGPSLLPGKPEQSAIFRAVLRTEKLKMPPKERNKLTEAEIALLKQWIAAGAPWPKTVAADAKTPSDSREKIRIATSGGQSIDWTNRPYDRDAVWAYQPIRRYQPPWKASGQQHPIDAFVAAKLKQQGFSFAPPADRRTLIRRISLDLTGLPPTSEQIEAFATDDSPKAYARLVNRLLASQHYGERWAQHWLDVVRYADTSGFANDYERPNAWRYRDYVIRSLNRDKPFDRFIIEQIAGDELAPGDPEMLIAVGFLRMGPWEHTGMSVAAITRQFFVDDVTHSVGVTFLGQGLRCAQCHDHKFDPLPTKDYYRIQAVFAPVQFADRKVPYQSWENTRSFAESKKLTEARLAEAEVYIAAMRKKVSAAIAKLLREQGVKRATDLPKGEQPHKQFYGLSQQELTLLKRSRKMSSYYQREMKRYEPLAFSLYNGPPRKYDSNKALAYMPVAKERRGPVPPVHILKGGSIEAEGEAVTPGVLSAVFGSNDSVQPTALNSVPTTMSGRRLALARWIASDSNTLTARVIVNRLWQGHFGRGLVDTPNGFGTMGGRPSHPELLDYLATWLIEHDWSLKKLHRLMVTSHVYQQGGVNGAMAKLAEVDANHRLLGYFPPRRLSAEEIRDAMLAVTGELNRELGGPGVYPEIDWEVALQPRHIMGAIAPPYQPSRTPRERNRRTIYAFRTRTLANPMLEVFNRPGTEKSCARRDETTVTPQVFALLNGQFVHDRALKLADRIMKSEKEPAKRIDAAFQTVYGRAPSDAQRKQCVAHVAAMLVHHRKHKPVIVKPPTSVEREMVEELTGKPIRWTEPLPAMKHYVSDLKPWDVGAETRALAELCLVLLNSNEFLYVR
jgi:mono/diheme cytochrome c family protein